MNQPDPTTDRERIAKALAGTALRPPYPHCLAMADAVLAVLPACPDPIECSHEAALGEAQARVERLALAFEVSGNEFIAEQIRAAVTGTEPAPVVPPAPTSDKAAALGLTPTEYRAHSHRAAVEAIRAALPGLYASVALRLEAALAAVPAAEEQPADAWDTPDARPGTTDHTLQRVKAAEEQPEIPGYEWCKCRSCWGWFVEEHPGEDLDELGRDLSWWSGLPEHRDAPAPPAVVPQPEEA